MNRLYICERPYPLYRTLIKCINSTDINDIVISNHADGNEKMYPVLKKTNLFRNVYFYDDQMYREFYSYGIEREFGKFPKGIPVLLKKLKMFIDLQNKAKNIILPEGLNIDDYDEIYVNDATSTMMFYLCHKGKRVIWVEHSKNVFQIKLGLVFRICFRLMPILEKLGLIYSLHGTSKWVAAIEVNSNTNLISLIKKKQIREVDIDKILEDMSVEDKNRIFELYCQAYNVHIDQSRPFYIILTAPLFMDGIVKSEQEQVDIYCNLIRNKIGTTENVLIKPHPRDSVDYSNCISGVMVGDGSMSAEIFNLMDGQLEAVYGIRTSVVTSFTNAKKRECYDVDQLDQFMN